jgi:hypothetical protein
MCKQQDKAQAVALLPGDVELYPRRTADDDVVEVVVVTEAGEQRPVRVALRPAVTESARAA